MRLLTAALVAPAITAVMLERQHRDDDLNIGQFFHDISGGKSMMDDPHVDFFFNEIFDFDAIVQANMNER